jgi:superfamily II DNA or RNA helicase
MAQIYKWSNVIKVTKINEVYLRVTTDPSISQELNDFFTFDVPGAKFMPLYKNRMWDGKARLYNMYRRELYVGLLPYLKEFANTLEYPIELDMENIGDPVSTEYVENFAKSLKLQSQEKDIEIRNYQIEAVKHAINNGRSLLLSPTASGKSLIIYTLIRYHQRVDRKQLIIVPTTSLVEQLYGDFQDYSTKDDWRVSENCHRIYGGKEKTNDYPITISTWQSIYKYPKSWFDKFDVIYGDEAHLFKAKSLTTILDKCVNSKYRIGTTGTLDGSKTHKLVLEGIFGTVKHVTTTKKLMDTSRIAELKIVAMVLDYPESVRKSMKDMTYQEEMDWLVSNNKRNIIIRNLSITQKGNTLVLFQYVEKHGRIIFDMINNKIGDTRKVFFVFGGTDTDTREQIRAITENETDAIIVASYGTFSTGINIRNLHNIVFASPSKSRVRNLQSIGRGLRKGTDKLSCNLFDIGDDLQWKSKKNYTLIHMIERIKLYNEEGFNYKLVRIPIDGQ